MRNSLLVFCLSFVFLVSCESDENTPDVTAPVIEIDDPLTGEGFAAGSNLPVEGEITDDIGLASYNITIHDNFDGHDHGRVLDAYDYDESFEASGTLHELDQEITIDTDVTAGPYHFIVIAIDEAGNSTSFADGSSIEKEIWITNDEMAEVHFQDSEGNEIDEFEAVAGENLSFYGLIEDLSGTMHHLDVELGHLEEEEHDDHDHDHRSLEEEVLYDQEFDLEGLSSVTLQSLLANEQIVVAESDLDELEEGEHLYLTLTVEDEDGNYSRFSLELHFD